MNYKFPIIRNISDVLPAIEGRDEFVVADRGDCTIISYNVMFEDTFLPVRDLSGSYERASSCGWTPEAVDDMYGQTAAKIRRECRGITFCNKTGDIIRRPLFKFFNINEKEETQINDLDFTKPHYIDTKLDGSMICPMLVNGEIVWGTKMASPDFHDLVVEFIENSGLHYDALARNCIECGYSPIFEFMHSQKRIVIDYPENNMVLLAVRNMVTGEFIDPLPIGMDYNIPVVDNHGSVEDPKSFMEYVHDMKNAEGFVIRWESGYRVKIKAHEYLQMHKCREAILQDRNIVEIILEEHLDDVKANVSVEDRDRLSQFENDFNKHIKRIVQMIWIDVQFFKSPRYVGDRKDFAIKYALKFDGFVRPIMFSMWDKEGTKEEIESAVHNTIRNNLGRTVKYEAIRDAWFPGVVFN